MSDRPELEWCEKTLMVQTAKTNTHAYTIRGWPGGGCSLYIGDNQRYHGGVMTRSADFLNLEAAKQSAQRHSDDVTEVPPHALT